jgi:hypothetical protein
MFVVPSLVTRKETPQSEEYQRALKTLQMLQYPKISTVDTGEVYRRTRKIQK